MFGFAPPRTPGAPAISVAEAVQQLTALFGHEAATPTQVHVRDWRQERWTSPDAVEELTAYELLGDQRYQQPWVQGRLHWASTETAPAYAGHVEGALRAAERAVAAITG